MYRLALPQWQCLVLLLLWAFVCIISYSLITIAAIGAVP